MSLDHRTGWDDAIAAAASRIREDCLHSLGNQWCDCDDDAARIEAIPYAAPKVPAPVTHADRVADPEPAPSMVARSKVAEAANATAVAIANGGDYFPEPIDDGARAVAAEAFRYFASLFEETP